MLQYCTAVHDEHLKDTAFGAGGKHCVAAAFLCATGMETVGGTGTTVTPQTLRAPVAHLPWPKAMLQRGTET
jgi:hypothetical protein